MCTYRPLLKYCRFVIHTESIVRSYNLNARYRNGNFGNLRAIDLALNQLLQKKKKMYCVKDYCSTAITLNYSVPRYNTDYNFRY
ncbi:hypothetical protein PUN28_018719 [Cardiocondyla obscurior]|uniref:Uncharacterized protein n=1 Tax=Cardiocondyla obscurior TaxID=286306 RepID=A0AAW2EGZ6_9HYME